MFTHPSNDLGHVEVDVNFVHIFYCFNMDCTPEMGPSAFQKILPQHAVTNWLFIKYHLMHILFCFIKTSEPQFFFSIHLFYESGKVKQYYDTDCCLK